VCFRCIIILSYRVTFFLNVLCKLIIHQKALYDFFFEKSCKVVLLLFIINISISLEDQYTLKNKYIEKHIEQRIRWYDNNRDDFFLIIFLKVFDFQIYQWLSLVYNMLYYGNDNRIEYYLTNIEKRSNSK
jgi:hypothetical protein